MTPEQGYTTSDVCHMLIFAELNTRQEMQEIIETKTVPLKVSIFVWRLLHNRIPRKDNLVHRGIIHQYDNSEYVNHLFFGCKFFWKS